MLNENIQIELSRLGPLWEDSQYRDTKDPCPVFDGETWHIFGSGGDITNETWDILHATAPDIDGPWTEQPSVVLHGLEGKHIAAPGVVYDNGVMHMFVQTEFLDLGGTIEYLTSTDGGFTFELQETALNSLPGTNEAALYDPHPAIIDGKKYMSYSGSTFIGSADTEPGAGKWVGKPDIFLAISESNTWYGPWRRVGKILDHKDVVHHNQPDHPSYEWGLEGSQLIQLPSGIVIMNVVCFLPHGEYGTRQRVFFAFASNVEGPYHTIGTVIKPGSEGWDSGENGHAAVFMLKKEMVLFYQGRPPKLQPWRYGIARFDIKLLEKIGQTTLRYHDSLEEIFKGTKTLDFAKRVTKLTEWHYIKSFNDYTEKLRSRFRGRD